MSSDQIETELRSIEHALHAALVRQLRVISLMALLLGVAGFFVGHFVADEQGRASVSPLEQQIHELQEQLLAVTERCSRQEAMHSDALVALQQLESLRRDESARDAAAINSLLSDIEHRRSLSLRELEAHVARRVSMPPQAVKAAINRFVDEHMLQLDRALAVVERRLDDGTIAATRAPLPPLEDAPSLPVPRAAPATTPGSLSSTTVVATAPAGREGAYFAPPAKKGYLFFSRNQPQRLDPVRVSESDAIPLPPR
jgi:hypothetical protein